MLFRVFSQVFIFSSGYNQWRDPMKPTQILSKLCKENKLESPHYFQDRVVIGRYCMTFSTDEVFSWNSPNTCKYRDEHLALAVLHRWEEIPRVGCKVSYITEKIIDSYCI
jgi:otoferlin